MNVQPEHLDAIPAEHRRIIARWLAERARQTRSSWVLGPGADLAADCLAGAAVDLVDPLAEDSTTSHAAAVLAALADEQS